MARHYERNPRWMFILVSIATVGIGVTAVPFEVVPAVVVLSVVHAALFFGYQVRANPTGVVAWFGVGVIRRQVALRDVHAFWVTRPTHLGVGATWGFGRLWTSAARSMLSFQLHSGRVIRIPTADPAGLCRAIAAWRPDLPRLAGKRDVI